MANYNVDIAVGISNLNALQRFKRELISLQRAVEDFNDKKLESGSDAEARELKKLARKKVDLNTKIIQNLANANLKSLENLTKKELELDDKVFKDKLQSIKDLQKAEGSTLPQESSGGRISSRQVWRSPKGAVAPTGG